MVSSARGLNGRHQLAAGTNASLARRTRSRSWHSCSLRFGGPMAATSLSHDNIKEAEEHSGHLLERCRASFSGHSAFTTPSSGGCVLVNCTCRACRPWRKTGDLLSGLSNPGRPPRRSSSYCTFLMACFLRRSYRKGFLDDGAFSSLSRKRSAAHPPDCRSWRTKCGLGDFLLRHVIAVGVLCEAHKRTMPVIVTSTLTIRP